MHGRLNELRKEMCCYGQTCHLLSGARFTCHVALPSKKNVITIKNFLTHKKTCTTDITIFFGTFNHRNICVVFLKTITCENVFVNCAISLLVQQAIKIGHLLLTEPHSCLRCCRNGLRRPGKYHGLIDRGKVKVFILIRFPGRRGKWRPSLLEVCNASATPMVLLGPMDGDNHLQPDFFFQNFRQL